MCNCNKNITVKVKKLYDEVVLPEQATSGSAGFDLRAYLPEGQPNIVVPPKGRIKIETGIVFELPEGHVMLIYPRSSTGIKKGLRLQNSTGVLDSDYRGNCYLFIENVTNSPVVIDHQERIAQAIILPYPKVTFEEAEELSETDRGTGGFGSTGQK